ncbi:hypothetical protein like AT3G24060 [Hibiscus trionum]|uniref:S-protein homolog n=1 Tax=Hibiscus trionum TaxID=183268 RepID=A0A9W7HGV5_HIBTR|nr:hypothetical protein like AT3G24060 [Hibiscus trionum]
MANIKGIALPLLLAFSVVHFPIAESAWLIHYHIHVRNDLPLINTPPGRPNLFLHCKSKDKDVGDRPMAIGQDYTWDTMINLLQTTLFFCNARWTGRKRITFNAFEAMRDETRCMKYRNSCMWSVRRDGIYFSGDNSTWKNEYPW